MIPHAPPGLETPTPWRHPVRFAMRALAPSIFAMLQAASVLERMTFDEGNMWLPKQL
jgi:hypothetical protein